MLPPFLLAFRGKDSIDKVLMAEEKQISDLMKGGIMGREKVFKIWWWQEEVRA